MFSTPRRRQAVLFMLGALIALLAMSTFYSIQRTAYLAETIRQNQKAGRQVLDRVNDCTTPGRKCFDQGQRRTANVVGDINRVTIYAASCGAQYPGEVAQVEACVRRQMEAERAKAP